MPRHTQGTLSLHSICVFAHWKKCKHTSSSEIYSLQNQRGKIESIFAVQFWATPTLRHAQKRPNSSIRSDPSVRFMDGDRYPPKRPKRSGTIMPMVATMPQPNTWRGGFQDPQGVQRGGRLNTEVFYGLFTGCLRPLTKGLSYSGRGSSGILGWN